MQVRRPKEQLAVSLLCHECGARHHGEDRFCARCGRPLLAMAQGDLRPARAADPPAQALPWVVLILGLAALTAALLAIPRPSTLTLAKVELGDGAGQVAQVLGKPTLPPDALDWRPGHIAVMWDYDPDVAAGVPNLSITFIDGRVRRVAVLDNHYATGDGLRVGDSLAKARQLYGTGIEEDPSGNLVPFKFLHGSEVVKVIVEQGNPTILAIGIEGPENLTLHRPAKTTRPPKGSEIPYYLDGQGTQL
ncbi:MAG: hypothetical protein KGR26_14535 [Cyanobacteria bacterium REEB65]|nr:hypothetical protein [Cyanobacteria bacterium REEB65]